MKKFLLLASMALGLVALALPASAMGSGIITENGAPLNDAIVSFEGKANFNTLGSGIECNVTFKTTVNGATVTPLEFNVTNPTTECTFFGAQYKECAFEQHPVTDHLNLAKITVLKPVAGALEHPVTITAPKDTETHPTLTAELTKRAGATNECTVTTNDLTVVSETNVNLSVDLETDKTVGGKIVGAKLTGQVRIDRGTIAQGTTTPVANVVNAVSGTLALEGSTVLTVG